MAPPAAESFSRVVYDKDGGLLRVTLAGDEQVRFPITSDSLPGKYTASVLVREDKRFYSHPGVDPLALLNAIFTNLKHGQQIRGGSTITMQLVRLITPRKRTYWNKLLECFIAVRMTLHFSKDEILKSYAAHVPMGGNNMGIEAASYRYFGKPVDEITWAEAALFSVLPHSPSMINLEKSRHALKKKRDRLLAALHDRKYLDSLGLRLAQGEPLPEPDRYMPFIAPHFTGYALRRLKQPVIRTTLDPAVQDQVKSIAAYYHNALKHQGIGNLAVVAAETGTGKVRAYLGSHSFHDSLLSGQVDGVQAFRSTGSLLKPFLAAQALDRGPFTLTSRLHDVPTYYGTFLPQNSSRDHSGLVTLHEMLVRSLNVPAIRLLHYFGLYDFYQYLKDAGLSSLFRSAEGYGLPIILGGAEASLWELTGMYAGLGSLGVPRPLVLLQDSAGNTDDTPDNTGTRPSRPPLCSKGAAWLVLETLHDLQRPGAEYYWHLFTQQVPAAWKTGTSYGQKDAWAIGTNRQWTIGVWAGNFSGDGNAMLGGASSAGPILFALFNQLSDKSKELWFEKPAHDLHVKDVCEASGYAPGPWCRKVVDAMQPVKAYKARTCPFHRRFIMDRTSALEVCSKCWTLEDTAHVIKTIYPPSTQSILVGLGHSAEPAPLHNPDCPMVHREESIEILYPVKGITIWVPRNLKGEYEKVVLKAGYQRGAGPLFWYLNDNFLGETWEQHTVPADLATGNYRLVIQDREGSTATVAFKSFRK